MADTYSISCILQIPARITGIRTHRLQVLNTRWCKTMDLVYRAPITRLQDTPKPNTGETPFRIGHHGPAKHREREPGPIMNRYASSASYASQGDQSDIAIIRQPLRYTHFDNRPYYRMGDGIRGCDPGPRFCPGRDDLAGSGTF